MKDIELTEVGRLYVATYTMHHTTKNLRKAFELYKNIITKHPSTKETAYAKCQIQNIVNTVVPDDERLSIQMDLAAAQFNGTEGEEAHTIPVVPLDSNRKR
jgi:hypothetical protein